MPGSNEQIRQFLVNLLVQRIRIRRICIAGGVELLQLFNFTVQLLKPPLRCGVGLVRIGDRHRTALVNVPAVLDGIGHHAVRGLLDQAFLPDSDPGRLDCIRFRLAQSRFCPHGAVIGAVNLIADVKKQQQSDKDGQQSLQHGIVHSHSPFAAPAVSHCPATHPK